MAGVTIRHRAAITLRGTTNRRRATTRLRATTNMAHAITRHRERRTGLIHTGAAGTAAIGADGTTTVVAVADVTVGMIIGVGAMMDGAIIGNGLAAKSGA